MVAGRAPAQIPMEKSIYSEDYLLCLEKLREARRTAGLTQDEVANRLGKHATQSFVSKCERGERRIDIVELRAFCRAIGVSFSQFSVQLDELLTKSDS